MDLTLLPDLSTDNVFDGMNIKDILKIRETSKEYKNMVDKYLRREHRKFFGDKGGDKDIDFVIKDIMIHRIFSKLGSRLVHTSAHMMNRYGIGDIIGDIVYSSVRHDMFYRVAPTITRFNNKRSYPGVFIAKLKIMDSLALDFPQLAEQIRIAVHHFVKGASDIITSGTHRWLDIYTQYRTKQGEEGIKILSHYNTDLELENPYDQIRTVLYDMFFRDHRCRKVNTVNGLLDSPLPSLAKINPNVSAVLPPYKVLAFDYFISCHHPGNGECSEEVKNTYNSVSMKYEGPDDGSKFEIYNWDWQDQDDQEADQDQETEIENENREYLEATIIHVHEAYSEMIEYDVRLDDNDRKLLRKFLAYKFPKCKVIENRIDGRYISYIRPRIGAP